MNTPSPFTAHNGFALPVQGFGTATLRGKAGAESTRSAIDLGYRLVDSAFNYENEGAVGRGLADAAVDRDEVVVTTKLAGRHHQFTQAKLSIEESRYRLGVDVIDLLLIHWPNPRINRYVEAWRALIDAQERGLVRQIGVSNFLPEHLDRLEIETGVLPVVNQIELHPYVPQVDALAYHRERGIITEAWSPLHRGEDLLAEPVVAEIAEAHGVTPAQAVLAWHATRGVVAIPRSSSAEHQRANLAAASITLSDEEVDALIALGHPHSPVDAADPTTHEEL